MESTLDFLPNITIWVTRFPILSMEDKMEDKKLNSDLKMLLWLKCPKWYLFYDIFSLKFFPHTYIKMGLI